MDELIVYLGLIVFMFVLIAIIYVVNGLGWMKLLKTIGHKQPWAGFVPIYGNVVIYRFITQEVGDPEWEMWVLALSPLYFMVPVVGAAATSICHIAALVLYCRWFSVKGCGAAPYILTFVFPLAVPFVMCKYYEG